MIFKHELQNILSGNGTVRHGENIKTNRYYPGRKKKAGSGFEAEWNKDQETEALIEHR